MRPRPRFRLSTPALWLTLGLGISISVAATLVPTTDSGLPTTDRPAPEDERLTQATGRHRLPLTFIENRGQVAEQVSHYIQRPGHSVYFTKKGLAVHLSDPTGQETRAHSLRIVLAGAQGDTPARSLEKAKGVVSYFKGSSMQWKTAIPTARSIAYTKAWPGIDLNYRGEAGQLQSHYVVASGADPGNIRLRIEGAEGLELDDRGNLLILTDAGTLTETAPVVWQGDPRHPASPGSNSPVEGRFRLLDERTVTVELGAYDPGRPLNIQTASLSAGQARDGSHGGDRSHGDDRHTVDAAGNTYVTGTTMSAEAVFPASTRSASFGSSEELDVFVAKIDRAGNHVYTAYIGGSEDDFGLAVAVDRAHNAYVTGYTTSPTSTFPKRVGPDLTYNGSGDAFIAKLDAAGTALVYAGYVGDSGQDYGDRIAIDSAGHAYLRWQTVSSEDEFSAGAVVEPDGDHIGNVSIAKVEPSGGGLIYSGHIADAGIVKEMFGSLMAGRFEGQAKTRHN